MSGRLPAIWCADIMVPVDPCAPGEGITAEGEDYPGGNELWSAGSGTIALAGASNEVLAFQLVVEQEAGAVQSIALAGGGGVKMSVCQNIAVPVGDRWADDPLVPLNLRAFEASLAENAKNAPALPGRRRQTFTVEFYIPKGSRAGRRDLELVVKAGDVEHRLAVALQVLGFELPDENACTADINNYSRVPFTGGIDADTTCHKYLAVQSAYFRLAREHRALFHLLPYGHSGGVDRNYRPAVTGWGQNRTVMDWTAFDRQWGALLDGRAFKGSRGGEHPVEYLYTPVNLNWPAHFENYGKPGFAVEFMTVLHQMAEHFKEKGWTKTKMEVFFNHKARWKFYPWDMDEIYYDRDNDVTVEFAKMAIAATGNVPGVQFVNRIDSSWIFDKSARTEIGDVVHLWVVNRGSHSRSPDEVALLRQKGQAVWFYGGAGAVLAASRVENLKWPWIAWGRETDGFCWWNGLGWGSWEKVDQGGNHCLYAGDRFGIPGPLASLRLKVLHRGMQDHAYLTLLDRKTGSRAAADAIIRGTIGCKDREDRYQRHEGAEVSGADIQTSSKTEKPWNTAPWSAWNAARTGLAKALASK